MSRECAQHRPYKSNYALHDYLDEVTPRLKRHYKRVVRRGRRASERQMVERARREMDTSTVEFKDDDAPPDLL